MSYIEIQKIVDNVVKIVIEVGKRVLKELNEPIQINEKLNLSDLVTQVDVQVEQELTTKIMEVFPHHWILSEEASQGHDAYQFMNDPPSGYGWIIDPIDGTTNFIHRIPHFAISVALVNGKHPKGAIIYNPMLDELYVAIEGHGATINGQALSVGPESTIDKALLATGFPAVEWRKKSTVIEQIDNIAGQARNVRILGSASLDLCLVAMGKLTGFWHDGLFPWDVAAGILIITEAGGKVTNGKGDLFQLSDTTLIASNGHIHKQLLQQLNS